MKIIFIDIFVHCTPPTQGYRNVDKYSRIGYNNNAEYGEPFHFRHSSVHGVKWRALPAVKQINCTSEAPKSSVEHLN